MATCRLSNGVSLCKFIVITLQFCDNLMTSAICLYPCKCINKLCLVVKQIETHMFKFVYWINIFIVKIILQNFNLKFRIPIEVFWSVPNPDPVLIWTCRIRKPDAVTKSLVIWAIYIWKLQKIYKDIKSVSIDITHLLINECLGKPQKRFFL